MKTSLLLEAGCLLALLSCNPLKLPTRTDQLRMEHLGTGNNGSGREEPPEGPALDTALYLSAVCVPPGYDWHRDTACGAASCRIVLLRNYEPVCSFPSGYNACVSTDPDTHHLLGGRLYTEFSTPDETVIKCNGTEVLRFEGREKLRGLMLRGADLYTLGQDRSGHGCSLRCNGRLLFHSDHGRIAGDFSHPAGKGGGALYEVDGHFYFSFFPDEEDPLNCCLVQDGFASFFVPPSDMRQIYDLRMGPDGPWLLYRTSSWITLRHGAQTRRLTPQFWNAGAIIDTGETALQGELDFGTGTPQRSYLFRKGKYSFLEGRGHQFFLLPEGEAVSVRQTEEGGVCICTPEETLFRLDSCHFFSRSCGDIRNGRLLAALSPYSTGARPFVWDRTGVHELDMEGFLTGLEVVSTPATTEVGIPPDQLQSGHEASPQAEAPQRFRATPSGSGTRCRGTHTNPGQGLLPDVLSDRNRSDTATHRPHSDIRSQWRKWGN